MTLHVMAGLVPAISLRKAQSQMNRDHRDTALRAGPVMTWVALRGDLAGKHSIRINDQWRIVFRWTGSGPEEVEITDYH